jgi:isopenicillin-N epimerase
MPSDSQFIDHPQLHGTRDFSTFLTVPRALEFREENDWDTVAANCRQLAQSNYNRFAEVTGGMMLCPATDQFLGQMCSVRINCQDPMALQTKLYQEYSIEIPVMPHGGSAFIRYSVNAYNSQEDLDKLFSALTEIKDSSTLLKCF